MLSKFRVYQLLKASKLPIKLEYAFVNMTNGRNHNNKQGDGMRISADSRDNPRITGNLSEQNRALASYNEVNKLLKNDNALSVSRKVEFQPTEAGLKGLLEKESHSEPIYHRIDYPEVDEVVNSKKSALLDKKNFSQIAQCIIDKYYLSNPMSSSTESEIITVNENLKEGYIRREIFGAMHASRVAIYVDVLHQLMKEIFPEYVEEVLLCFKTNYLLDESSILLLAQYISLCNKEYKGEHTFTSDSLPSDFELKDSMSTYSFLLANGIEESLASLLSNYTEPRNKNAKLEQTFESFSKERAAFSYLDCLIRLANAFDTIRYTEHWNARGLINLLEIIPGFDKKLHVTPFFNFAIEVCALLKSQHDLHVATELIGPSQVVYTVPLGLNDFCSAEKIKLEHADNAFLAVMASMRKQTYFAKYLKNEPQKSTNLYLGAVAFNPFIHGTNSEVLALCSKTDFTLLSAYDMLEKYLLADSRMNKLDAFCRMTSQGHVHFTRLRNRSDRVQRSLEHTIDSVSHPVSISLEEIKKELKSMLGSARNVLFFNIDKILIRAAQYRQLGGDLGFIDEQRIFSEAKHVTQLFYLYLLVGHYIVPDDKVMKPFLANPNYGLYGICRPYLSGDCLLDKIGKESIDLKSIYLNPTEENLKKVLKFLELPSELTDGFKLNEAPLPINSFSGYLRPYDEKSSRPFLRRFEIEETKKRDNKVLISHLCGSKILVWAEEEFLQHVQWLEERVSLLRRLVETTFSQMDFSAEQDLLTKPFPIILIYNKEDRINSLYLRSQEYCTTKPLVLGKDIISIATDTEKNCHILKHYLSIKKLPIEVCLFSDLFKAREQPIKTGDNKEKEPKADANTASNSSSS